MSILSKLRKPATLAGGIPICLPEPLTLSHPHCRVVTRDFRVGFVEWPGVNGISPGLTVVRAGQLLDDRSAVARHAPKGALRRPTKAERQAHSVEQPAAALGEPPAPTIPTAGTAAQAHGDQLDG